MIKDNFKASKRNIQEYFWKDSEFMKEIYEKRYERIMNLEMEFAYSTEPVPFKDKDKLEYKKININDVWSKENFGCAWFHITGTYEGVLDDEIFLGFENNGEALLVDKEGSALKGFTCGSVWGTFDNNTVKRYYPLSKIIDENGKIDIYIDAASNGFFGNFEKEKEISMCGIYRRNVEIYNLCVLFDCCLNYVHFHGEFSDNELVTPFILGMKKVYNIFKYNENPDIKEATKILEELLKSDGNISLSTTAVGHAHLDLAWLWPIRETKRKALRTFANCIYLIEKYPFYTFVISQPQQLEWVKELDPKLYAKIKKYEKTGNFEIIGGGWVESDTNMPSGESLVRQELYGQKFWQEEFGKYVNVKWLPDTFGYTGSMPQILKKSKQDYFMTIKISWSTYTVFPYQTFNWKGIDGTDVLCHMPPEGTYNSALHVSSLLHAMKNIKETDPKDSFLSVYGIGDGGAGPSEYMIDRAKKIENTKFLPKIKFGNAHEFYKSIERNGLRTYDGEMYLEKHRGTYTSQSNNKNFNRRMEEELISYETLLSSLNEKGNKEVIDKIWKEVLLYQFHDILPGSSIKRVYDETDASYKILFDRMESLANEKKMSYIPNGNLYNPTRLNVNRLYKKDSSYLRYSGSELSIKPESVGDFTLLDEFETIKTDFYTLEFNADGSFKYMMLNNGFKCLENANKLRVFKDTGDAWDFEDDYRDQKEMFMDLESKEMKKYDSIYEITLNYVFKDSKLKETIIIDKKSPVVRVNHDVNSKNLEYMVRSEAINNVESDVCRSDIQFGYLERSLKNDTVHEDAQYETCAHKWFDISNDKVGVSYLNNAKTGFMAKNDIISLNLFRSTNYPCVEAEHKNISYNYGIMVHEGGFDPIYVDDLAEDFNKMYLFGESVDEIPSSSSKDVVISSMKPAYDENGFILRLYERSGKDSKTAIDLKGYEIVSEVDLLEDSVESVSEIGAFKPFEIKSFRIIKIN